MVPLICGICVFIPAPAGAMPNLEIPAETRPWSEASGPWHGYRVWLMSTDVALVTVAETWQAGSMSLKLPTRPFAILRKEGNSWRVAAILPTKPGG